MDYLTYVANYEHRNTPTKERKPATGPRANETFSIRSVSSFLIGLIVGGDMDYLHSRSGLVEFFNVLFMTRTLRSVVQVVTTGDGTLRDKVAFRSLQFQAIENIEEKLDQLGRKGINHRISAENRCCLGKVRIVDEQIS